jgi:hypothetical protein
VRGLHPYNAPVVDEIKTAAAERGRKMGLGYAGALLPAEAPTAVRLTVTALGDTGFHLGTGLYFGFDGHWHGEWRGELHVDGEWQFAMLRIDKAPSGLEGTLELPLDGKSLPLAEIAVRPERVRACSRTSLALVSSSMAPSWMTHPVMRLRRSWAGSASGLAAFAVKPSRFRAAHAASVAPARVGWSAVLSRPETRLAILGFGRRDAPFDAGLPVPLWVRGDGGDLRDVAGAITVRELNDQHAFAALPEGGDLAVGDLVGCGISHPCTMFDKWSAMLVVDDAYRVTDVIRTFF